MATREYLYFLLGSVLLNPSPVRRVPKKSKRSPMTTSAAAPRMYPTLLALEQPTSSGIPNGSGRWALGATHLAKSPSLQPSPMIQSAVLVAATITITVMKQQVKAITLSGLVTVMVSIVTCGAPILDSLLAPSCYPLILL